MKRKRPTKKLLYEKNSLANLLFEQEEEDPFADTGEEEAAEEEAPAEEEAAADEDVDAEEGAEEEGEEEEEKLEVDLDDEVKLTKSIDQDLEALFIDFETDARKSKEIAETEPEPVEENLHLGMLLEQNEYESEIDLERFTSEVARLVKNYTSLLDMEKMLVSKAREFVAIRYGEEAEKELVSLLKGQHNIDITEPTSPKTGREFTPVAAGAGSGAAGGTV